jgi:hypothetical protein
MLVLNETNTTDCLSCHWFLNNPGLPILSAFANVVISGGVNNPSTVNFNASSLCMSFVELPPQTDLYFAGNWNRTSIDGAWGHLFNLPSATAPPLISLINVAVVNRTANARVEGIITVTISSELAFSQQVCCGCCTENCGATTTSSTPVQTTTTGAQATTVVTTASVSSQTTATGQNFLDCFCFLVLKIGFQQEPAAVKLLLLKRRRLRLFR